AAIAALRAAGARSVFAYGNGNAEWANLPSATPHSHDARRIRAQHFSAQDGLVSMALALRGPQFTTTEALVHDWQLAREPDLAMERALVNQRALQAGTSVDRLSLTTRDVLEFATLEGARACGLADRVGALSPGKQADLILVRTDGLNLTPLNNPVGALVVATHPGDVDSVFVAGRALKRHGKLLYSDLPGLRARAVASRDYLLAR